MVSVCDLSFIGVASLAVMLSFANAHPSSTWSTVHRGRLARASLYRRGGSAGTDIGSLSTYIDEVTLNGTNTNTAATILSSLSGGQPHLYSTCSVQGERQYMEDEYFVEEGKFASVFDGHGGAAVSRYLRQNLYANFQAALPSSASEVIDSATGDESNASMQTDVQSTIVSSALRVAFDKVDNEVGSISHWSFQGSTALAVVIYENFDGSRSIVSANVGDSRAILSRNRVALDLTKDHKPNDAAERERVEALGGEVNWCGGVDTNGNPILHTGVYRINGNLALSRAIGDRSERPWVTNEADFAHYLIDEENDSFVLLATDGLYDVMTSQEIVTFIHEVIDNTPQEYRQDVRKGIAKYVVEEALRRGSNDNITVVVLCLNEEDEI